MSRPSTPLRAQRIPLPPSPLITSSSPPRTQQASDRAVRTPPSTHPQRYPPSAYITPTKLRQIPQQRSPAQGFGSPKTPSNTRGGRAYHFQVEGDGAEELGGVKLEQVQPHHSPFHDSKAWIGLPGFERSPSGLSSRRLQDITRGPPEIEVETSSAGSSRSSGLEVTSKVEGEMELDLQKKKEMAEALELPIPIQALVSQEKEQAAQASQEEIRNLPEFTYRPPSASFALLFSQLTRREKLINVIPAILLAAASSVIAPIMTILIGDAFGIFLLYPVDVTIATAAQKSALAPAIGKYCLYLAVLGFGGMALNIVMIRVWIGLAEKITDRLRMRVYSSVMRRGMEWFDLGMGQKGAGNVGDDAVGAGGLMAKFTKETDDVRIGSGRYFGEALRGLISAILCIILSFWKCWSLTLVLLSAMPLLLLGQALTEQIGNPLYYAEIAFNSQLATHIERCSAAISTAKAFNAQKLETDKFVNATTKLYRAFLTQVAVWALSQGFSTAVVLLMFVAGFWYAEKLVTSGKASAADVVTVFWSSLLASGSLTATIPLLVYVTRGKAAMSALVGLIEQPSPVPRRAQGMFISGPIRRTSIDDFLNSTPATPLSPIFATRGMIPVGDKAIIPLRRSGQLAPARGEIDLQGVTFSYPSRPDMLVLDDVSLFLPAGEMTFIVGGSGSGKSTVAQLLLRLYDPLAGIITLDNQDLRKVEPTHANEHVGAVQQGCVLFDMSVHDNVAMGLAGLPDRTPASASRPDVIEACKMAMLHDFIVSLPDGYETRLGTKGSSLSGGQKQRLTIARARLRDPTLLVLDECTSALDATSRIVVFEGIKRWRRNRSTIVITHDLSQIQPGDFLYLMKDGKVTEQGFRSDLLAQEDSIFGRMATEQAVRPLSEDRRKQWADGDDAEGILEQIDRTEYKGRQTGRFRPVSMYTGIATEEDEVDYLDILSDYLRRASISDSPATNRLTRNHSPKSNRMSLATGSPSTPERDGNTHSRHLHVSDSPSPMQNVPSAARRLTWNMPVPSLAGSPNFRASLAAKRLSYLDDKGPITRDAGGLASGFEIKVDRKLGGGDLTGRWSDDSLLDTLGVEVAGDNDMVQAVSAEQPAETIPALWRRHLPHVPRKWGLCLSVILSMCHGITIPIWSKYLASLMAGVSGQSSSSGTSFNMLSVIVAVLSVADGVFQAGSYFGIMGTSAGWLVKIRKELFGKVLKQEQGWFDRSENAPTRLVQRLVKDADDMRPLIAQIIARFLTVIAMMILGIVWSLAISWRLALVGVAIAPIFGAVVLFQSKILNKLETQNKVIREAISKTLYESIANIRAIRTMALEGIFSDMYEKETHRALISGTRAAWGIALGVGLSLSLPYMVQALMLYIIALFMAQGTLTYERALQVFSLIIFSLQYAADIVDFVPNIAIARMAAKDLDPIFKLSEINSETRGDLRFPINGNVSFDDIHFTYPTRPDVPILKGVSFHLEAGECVAIVGASGSGKSTIAGLLQRLYDPGRGVVRLDHRDLADADVRWVRDHVAVVSQQANLFDATVAENIAYGSPHTPMEEIYRASREANVHDFIMTLPKGYQTNLGENASLISGGQAQRLQIARALIRRSTILILDECTSALDSDNQKAVLDTVMKLKSTRTTIFVTHKADVMRRCDRVLCLAEGVIAEEGPYEELVRGRGVFAKLMSAGEWE